jgi:uncharacterized GH25 family protein
MKILHALLLACAGFALPVEAHDFWIQPDSFLVATDGTVSFSLQAGHGPERQRSSLPFRRLARFAELTPGGRIADLRGILSRAEKNRDGSYGLPDPGVHLLFLETDNRAQSHLPAGLFNEYLRTEGLVPALAHRAGRQSMNEDGFERYSRVSKALIQVGPAGSGDQDPATAALGLALEIILDRSPYLEPRAALLPIHVMYEGRPLAGAVVKLTNLEHDAAPVETQLTDAGGRANFTMPNEGAWLLNVVWTKLANKADGIDFDTTFSSLSFGVPGRPIARP